MRVLIVDDHQLFRRGVSSLLAGREDIEVVGEANNGAEAVERARELMPDVVLMDIKMPELDGLAATKQLKAEMPYVRIMMLTVSETDEDLFEAIKAGASGYLLKNVDPDHLVASVLQVQRGEVPIAPTMAAKILRELTTPSEAPIQSLTSRERQVLELLASGMANKEIAFTLKISENTVKNHLRNILEKLHLQNRVQAALYAVRMGLADRSSDPS
ncbi:MAG: DNA-binding response regulator [Armatimonadetes bacterium RBG_19FT_COMBO_69_19]|nr:MAG: DNA-binding response regulator [Armatimonadetes bacterium RBG_19FT_COMBO_69_19]